MPKNLEDPLHDLFCGEHHPPIEDIKGFIDDMIEEFLELFDLNSKQLEIPPRTERMCMANILLNILMNYGKRFEKPLEAFIEVYGVMQCHIMEGLAHDTWQLKKVDKKCH